MLGLRFTYCFHIGKTTLWVARKHAVWGWGLFAELLPPWEITGAGGWPFCVHCESIVFERNGRDGSDSLYNLIRFDA